MAPAPGSKTSPLALLATLALLTFAPRLAWADGSLCKSPFESLDCLLVSLDVWLTMLSVLALVGGPLLAVALVVWAWRRGVGSVAVRVVTAVLALVVPTLAFEVSSRLVTLVAPGARHTPILWTPVLVALIAGHVALAVRWLRASTPA